MSDRESSVSIIIPTYNRARYLTKAIDSVLAQTYTNYEIIVVDDGSTDNTKEVLEPYMDRITYLYQENTGVSAARNTGIRAARGKWIAFLDSDDEWMPEKLSIQVGDFSKRPDICAHITNIVFISPNIEPITLFEVRKFRAPKASSFTIEKPFQFILNSNIAVTPSFIVNRDTLFHAGLYDPAISIAEDWDLFLRVALQGAWGCSSVPLVHVHRRKATEKSLQQRFHKNPIDHREATIYLLNKIRKKFHLQEDDKIQLTKVLGNKFFEHGYHLYKAGRKKQARRSFNESIKLNTSLKSNIKYILTLLPFSFGFWLLERRFFRRRKRFYI